MGTTTKTITFQGEEAEAICRYKEHVEGQIARLQSRLSAAEKERDEAKAWRDAVEDELVVCCILNESHSDPRKAVQDQVGWNVEVALDPRVSERAAHLRQEIMREALEVLSLAEDALEIANPYITPYANDVHDAARDHMKVRGALVAIRRLAEEAKQEGKNESVQG